MHEENVCQDFMMVNGLAWNVYNSSSLILNIF